MTRRPARPGATSPLRHPSAFGDQGYLINFIWHSEPIKRYSATPTQHPALCELDMAEFVGYAAEFEVGTDR